jgi:hypothetical protein
MFLSELISLFDRNKDKKSLNQTIRELNKIDVVLEAFCLEACDFPY